MVQMQLCSLAFLSLFSLAHSYIAIDTTYEWKGAIDYCYYRYQSNLATISSSTESDDARIACSNVTTSSCWLGLNDLALNNNFKWIANDSSNTSYFNWQSGDPDYFGSGCVVISASNGEWDDIRCDEEHVAICNDANTADPPSNLSYIGFSGSPVSWFEADSYCYLNYQSHLATITSLATQNEVANVCRNTSTSYPCWIGLGYFDGSYRWINDSSVYSYTNWDYNEPYNVQGYCAYLSTFAASGRYWKTDSCEDSNSIRSFVCNPAMTAQQPSSIGFIGVYLSSMTWYDADDYCVSTYRSHLATITSEQENNEAGNACATASGNHDCFIGINTIGDSSQFRWVNDSSLPQSYDNWYYYSEPYKVPNQIAFMDYVDRPRYWFSDGSTTKKSAFVCNPINTTVGTSSAGYIGYRGIDIQIGSSTWFAADDWCYWTSQSHLATIKSEAENNEAIETCRGLDSNSECWIGLVSLPYGTTQFRWISDGSDFKNYFSFWYEGEPNCWECTTRINSATTGRYWKDYEISPTTTSPNFLCDPLNSAVSPSSVGYVAHKGGYNFYDSDDLCIIYHESRLATITTESQNHEAVNLCRDLNTSYNCWIGANNVLHYNGAVYSWLSDSSNTNINSYAFWYPGEPDQYSYTQKGAIINSLGATSGRFWTTHIASSTAEAFLCDPSSNNTVSVTSLGYIAHQISDIGAGSYSWTDADQYCFNMHKSHLATIKSEAQNNEVIEACRTVSNGGRCWIGINNVDNVNQYTWKNDSSLANNYNKWFPDEPAGGNNDPYCGIIHDVGSGYGRYWRDIQCSISTVEAFVCDPGIGNYTTSPSTPPTNHPTTINPTTAPITDIPTTANPTITPTTSNPTSLPTTSAPSSSPITSDPSLSPTTAAPTTSDPSVSPTTSYPSLPPTTSNPTSSPTTLSPTTSSPTPMTTTTEFDVNAQKQSEEQKTEKQNLESTFSTVTLVLVIIVALIALISFIDGKWYRKNDFFSVAAVFGAGLQTLDMLSDCFFAINIYIASKYIDELVPALIASIAFIVIPSILSLLQLFFYSRKHWLNDDGLRTYLALYSKHLYLLSIMTGSSFAAISLLNSDMFKLNVFSMGLSKRQMMRFSTKRVYSVVLLENMPQLIIQAWWIIFHGGSDDLIAICSLILSLISIIVTVMAMIMQKQLMFTQQHMVLKMDVTGNCIIDKVEKCRTNVNKIKKYICSNIGVPSQAAEIMKPQPIAKGLELKVYVYINVDNQERKTDYLSLLNQLIDNGELQGFVKQVWKLETVPKIYNAKTTKFESKKDRKSTDRTNVTEGVQLATTATSSHSQIDITP